MKFVALALAVLLAAGKESYIAQYKLCIRLLRKINILTNMTVQVARHDSCRPMLRLSTNTLELEW